MVSFEFQGRRDHGCKTTVNVLREEIVGRVSEHSRAADVYMHICFMPKNLYFICGLLFLASFFRGEGAVVLGGNGPGGWGGRKLS